MLVLTRKCNDTIKIGNEITIKVIQTGRGSVKLGIEAPAHIRVLRGELAEFSKISPMSATQFLVEFDAEYVADLEDQLLVSTAS